MSKDYVVGIGLDAIKDRVWISRNKFLKNKQLFHSILLLERYIIIT